MPRKLARLLGFPVRRHSAARQANPAMNEVTEHEGALLVRLGRGSAMQVRFDPGEARAVFRIVPIAEARRLYGDTPWHPASESQLQGWIHSDSATGRWLLSRSLNREKAAAAAAGGELAFSLR